MFGGFFLHKHFSCALENLRWRASELSLWGIESKLLFLSRLQLIYTSGGVIGLTTAFRLTESCAKYSVAVVAEHMPGDESSLYTSPWAGANYLPMSFEGTPSQRWERDTGPFLWNLAESTPAAGVHATRKMPRTQDLKEVLTFGQPLHFSIAKKTTKEKRTGQLACTLWSHGS